MSCAFRFVRPPSPPLVIFIILPLPFYAMMQVIPLAFPFFFFFSFELPINPLVSNLAGKKKRTGQS